jgi:ribosome-associated protein
MGKAFKAVAVAAARAADAKKGEEISLLHVTKTSPITDYLLIVTANSRPHLESIEREIEEAVEAFHLSCLHKARPASDTWRVLDFGGMLVHVMTAETRQFYALDKLYHDAPRVTWEEAAAPKTRRTHARSH